MSEPHLVGDGVLAGDGLVHLFGSVMSYPDSPLRQALDLRDCSMKPRPAVPTKATGGAIISTTDGRIIIFGGEADNTIRREVYSLDLYEKDAWLGSVTTETGTPVRVYAKFEATSFDNDGMTGTAYLVKGGITCGSCLMTGVGNGTASGLMEVPEDLAPGSYQIIVTDVDTGIGIAGMIEFDPLALTVTEAPAPPDRLAELQDQLSQLRNDLNDTRAELADLQESSDGKMEASVGYVLMGLIIVALATILVILLRKK
jgi:hypothetical protein